MGKTFKEKVLEVAAKIPQGEFLTYKKVAELAGNPKAYRAVGNILNKNYDPKIPCHRVIRSDGTLGGYNKGIQNKLMLLKKERVYFNRRGPRGVMCRLKIEACG